MLTRIRPWQILFAVPEEAREVHTLLPGGNTGLSTLELSVILALEKLVRPDRVLEFGTYCGETTYLLAANAEPSAHVWTIDLDSESVRKVAFHLNPLSRPQEDFNSFCPKRDWDLANRAVSAARYFADTPAAARITQILGDSTKLELGDLGSNFDLVFIDANHDYEYVRSDSRNALRLSTLGRRCVVWHDYESPDFPGVKAFVDELAREIDLYRVEETTLVVLLEGVQLLGPQ